MRSQITAHAQALTLLDEVLIPQARDASLRQELQNERGSVAEHLALAESLAASGRR